MSDGLGPFDLHFAAIGKTVAQVQVNEALIRHTCLIGHALKILHNVFRKPHRDGVLKIERVGVSRDLSLARSYSAFMCVHPGKTCFHAWLLFEPK